MHTRPWRLDELPIEWYVDRCHWPNWTPGRTRKMGWPTRSSTLPSATLHRAGQITRLPGHRPPPPSGTQSPVVSQS